MVLVIDHFVETQFHIGMGIPKEEPINRINFRGRNFQRPFNYYPNRQGQSNLRGRRDPSRRIYTFQAENSVQGVPPQCPSIPTQFHPAVIPAQPHHFANYPQPIFLDSDSNHPLNEPKRV